MEDKTKFVIGVVGIIFDEQKRILLVHRRDYDLWNLPGGGIEAGETPWETTIREVKEESGFEVEISKLLGVYSKPDKDEITFSFLCKVVGGQATLNDEADKIEYFEIGKIPHNTSPKQIERINDALVDLDKTILKKQIGKSSVELIKEGKL